MSDYTVEPILLHDLDPGDEFMQSRTWAEAKRLRGMKPLAFRLRTGAENISLLALEQQPDRPGGIVYIPHGPGLAAYPSDYAQAMTRIAREIGVHIEHRPACIRFDLPWPSLYWDEDPYEGKPAAHLQEIRMNFGRDSDVVRKAPTDVLPVDTLVLDLEAPEKTLLGRMKSKTRYNIRLAARHGVRVDRYTAGSPDLNEALAVWARLAGQTEARNALSQTDSSHVASLFSQRPQASPRPGDADVELYVARAAADSRYGPAPLAAAVITRTGAQARYLYGASADIGRSLMGPYALQWAAICDAKRRGARYYDFFGVPPVEDARHPLAGLGRFKRGFGGREIHYAGCWDVPMDPATYEVLRSRESAGPAFHASAGESG